MAAQDSTPIGARFNKLVVISESYRRANHRSYVTWRCDCGTEKEIECYSVVTGRTTSCGCHKLTFKRTGNVTHGNSRTPAWRSYYAMMTRCYNAKQKNWHNYGGRGIVVCDRWREGFEFFLADMGERPDGMTLDRFPDVNGNYEPGNCRWATDEEQINNKRDSVYLEFDGLRLTVAQWATRTGINRKALDVRLGLGWSIGDALTIATVSGRNQFGEGLPVEHDGQTKTWMQWAESTGISYYTLKKRIENGWTIERALSMPLRSHLRK